jgi:glucose/arabinose dehydrogenase
VQHLAGHQSLGSIIAMTFDDHGRMVMARENGPLMLIEDRNQDGIYDQIRTYTDRVTGAQGLLSVGGRLYVVGSGPDGVGLYRLTDPDQDGWLERVETLVRFQDTSVEHGPHNVVLGPDGYLYLLVGNHGVLVNPVQDGPYGHAYEGDLVQPRWQDPGGHAAQVRAPGGVILRLDRDGEQIETYAGGLRNPYDIAFSPQADLFTHDADMESDMGTTWYRPTRVLHLIAGGEYGWRSGWAKWPEYYLDSLPAIAHTGRGSPTGAVYYDHPAFPARFHNALFLADWSEGRILFCRLEPVGAGYRATAQVFMEGQPLNVTDLEVGPDGALYVVTGGRDTSGNLYRI